MSFSLKPHKLGCCNNKPIELLTLMSKIVIYKGEKGWFESPLATYKEGKLYEGKKSLWEDPILTVNEDKIYKGEKGWFEDPIATVVENKVYEGDKGFWESPIGNSPNQLGSTSSARDCFGKWQGQLGYSPDDCYWGHDKNNHPADCHKDCREFDHLPLRDTFVQ